MSGRFAISSIAGVDLTDLGDRDARVDVLDGEGLKTSFTGTSKQALDFSVHTQLTARAAKGVHFGARAAQLPTERVNEIVAAIEAAMTDDESFEVVMHDESGTGSSVLHDITATVVPDYAALAGKVFTHGALSNLFVKDLVFRFITL
jgi:hypothetical protein